MLTGVGEAGAGVAVGGAAGGDGTAVGDGDDSGDGDGNAGEVRGVFVGTGPVGEGPEHATATTASTSSARMEKWGCRKMASSRSTRVPLYRAQTDAPG